MKYIWNGSASKKLSEIWIKLQSFCYFLSWVNNINSFWKFKANEVGLFKDHNDFFKKFSLVEVLSRCFKATVSTNSFGKLKIIFQILFTVRYMSDNWCTQLSTIISAWTPLLSVVICGNSSFVVPKPP